MSGLSGAYEMSLCNVGIMGTKYVRTGSYKPEATYSFSTTSPSKTIHVSFITASPAIGNTLDIRLRLRNAADLSWVRISNYVPEYNREAVKVTPSLATVGTYTLYLESYDNNSSV